MHSHAELKGLADRGGAHTLTDATPEGRVEEDHVDGRVEDVGAELLEIDHDGVRGQRHPHLVTNTTEAVKTEDRILQVIVSDVLDVLAEPDRLFGRPHTVRVEPE